MIRFFTGFIISTLYGFLAMAFIWKFKGESEAIQFIKAYTIDFKTIISLGLSLGTAFVVLHTQGDIPTIIEEIFTKEQLKATEYFVNRERFESLYRTINFITQVTVVAFFIFRYCRFPLPLPGQVFMLLAVCAEYAFASFVGRKLRYAAMMMHSLSDVKVTRNLFKDRELDSINWYVNVASTLTMIFVYVHVMFYYKGPFAYDTVLKESIRIFLILPAIMATPVLLIFNFYPREVLRKLYSKSIDIELENLRRKLRFEKLNSFEKRSYLIEFQKMSREELRYSLQLALTDLPIGITILAMVLQTLLKQ
jgi:hypothetical protein